MHTILDGPFRIILDLDGSILAVQCRVSGVAASLRYPASLVASAARKARDIWLSLSGE